jgi:multicomponent K+:H+ antiporter subunit G
MTPLDDLPLWLAVPVMFFLIIGSTLTMLGAFGLLHLRSFYDRIHAPTLGTSWGTAAILLASILAYSWTESRLAHHEVVIGIFVMVTTPVTLMLLGRAALLRDRDEGRPDIPNPRQVKATLDELNHPGNN